MSEILIESKHTARFVVGWLFLIITIAGSYLLLFLGRHTAGILKPLSVFIGLSLAAYAIGALVFRE